MTTETASPSGLASHEGLGRAVPSLKVGDAVVLVYSDMWHGTLKERCDDTFVITGLSAGDFGSGFGARVSPAIQPILGDDVWYDLAHFARPNTGGEA